MAAHQLLVDGVQRVLDAEQLLLARHLGVEHRLEHEVAQFLGELRPIAMVDGVQHLIGLFQGEGLDAVEGLFAVPRAAARAAQAGHDRDQLLKLLAGSFLIHSVWGSDFPQCNISSMPDLLIAKPDASEHAPYYSRYVDLVADGDILGTLATQIDGTLAELRKVSEADSLKRYAAGKWSIREVLGHLIDTERIFAYRALRFARGDRTDLPGFEQDDYVAAAQFDRRPWAGLLQEFEAVRRSNLLMFRGLGVEAWRRQGVANGNAMSVRAAAYIIAGHELHHMSGLREHYGL